MISGHTNLRQEQRFPSDTELRSLNLKSNVHPRAVQQEMEISCEAGVSWSKNNVEPWTIKRCCESETRHVQPQALLGDFEGHLHLQHMWPHSNGAKPALTGGESIILTLQSTTGRIELGKRGPWRRFIYFLHQPWTLSFNQSIDKTWSTTNISHDRSIGW